MLRTYCTLFDKNYLYQAIALHRSLLRHGGAFRLFALCMDNTAFQMIEALQSDSLIPVSVGSMMEPDVELLRLRTTHGQFCWACQPLICQYVLDNFEADMVTYLESDSLFFSSPEALFNEIGDRSVSLVPHNYSSEFDNSAAAGRFCVQFNAFRNDPVARAVLSTWRNACFQYDKERPRSYPGQTCLDNWPAEFSGVAVIEHPGAGVAPWNISGYRLEDDRVPPLVDGQPVVFYHYHQYGRLKNGSHEIGSYPMTGKIVDCFYVPYVEALREAQAFVQGVDPRFSHRREYEDYPSMCDVLRRPSPAVLGRYLEAMKRRIRGRFNVRVDAYFDDALMRRGRS